jgi:hypothetical protein
MDPHVGMLGQLCGLSASHKRGVPLTSSDLVSQLSAATF